MRVRIDDQRLVLPARSGVEEHHHDERQRLGDRDADQKPRRARGIAHRRIRVLPEQKIREQQTGDELDDLLGQLRNARARHALQTLQIAAIRAHERNEQQRGRKRHHRILRADVAAQYDRADPLRAEEHQRRGHNADQKKKQQRTAEHAPRAVVVADCRALRDHAGDRRGNAGTRNDQQPRIRRIDEFIVEHAVLADDAHRKDAEQHADELADQSDRRKDCGAFDKCGFLRGFHVKEYSRFPPIFQVLSAADSAATRMPSFCAYSSGRSAIGSGFSPRPASIVKPLF